MQLLKEAGCHFEKMHMKARRNWFGQVEHLQAGFIQIKNEIK